MRDYVTFLEEDPVAKYARMMGNFVATNVDEQLIAAYLYLSTEGQSAADRDKALQIAHYSGIRQKDQIDNGVFRYESPRQRSLDFSQQCLLVRVSFYYYYLFFLSISFWLFFGMSRALHFFVCRQWGPKQIDSNHIHHSLLEASLYLLESSPLIQCYKGSYKVLSHTDRASSPKHPNHIQNS